MSNEAPLVSLLIPICNVEKYLEACLDSAVSQTLKNIEIICINDGSTDSSLDIIKRYQKRDDRIICIDKANSGYGDSMNQGLLAARGEYIGILESDDILDSEGLDRLYTIAHADKLDLIKSNFYFYWSEVSARTNYSHNLYFDVVGQELSRAGIVEPKNFQEIFLAKPSIWSALYRRDFLRENAITFLPTPGASYQDLGFTFKVLALAKRARFVSDAYLHYRQDNENSSVNSLKKVFCVCDEHHEISRWLKEEHPELDRQLAQIRIYQKYLNYRWNFDRIGKDHKKDFLDVFVKELQEDIEAYGIALRNEPVLAMEHHMKKFQLIPDHDLKRMALIIENPSFFKAKSLASFSTSKNETIKIYYSFGGIQMVIRGFLNRKE